MLGVAWFTETAASVEQRAFEQRTAVHGFETCQLGASFTVQKPRWLVVPRGDICVIFFDLGGGCKKTLCDPL